MQTASDNDLEKRSYHLWEKSVLGDYADDMIKIPDQNGDGYKDFVFLSSVSGNGYITIRGGKNGTKIKEKVLGYEPEEVLYLSNHIIVSKDTGLEAFDTNLNSLYTVSGLDYVECLQELNGNIVLLSDWTNILCYDPSTGNLNWNYSHWYGGVYGYYADYDYSGFLVVSNWIVAPFPNFDTDTYDFELLKEVNGTLSMVEWSYFSYSSSSDTVEIYPYETYTYPYFMLAKENDTKTMLYMNGINDSVDYPYVFPCWRNQIDTASASVGTIIDVNGDGYKEILSIWAGNLTIYNASITDTPSITDGSILYITDIDVGDIMGTAILSDITNNGLKETVVSTWWYTYLISFDSTGSSIVWNTYCEGPMGTISDIDGDELEDLVIFGAVDSIYCYWGNYDDSYPTISDIHPEDGIYTNETIWQFKTKAGDPQSGIDFVEIDIEHDFDFETFTLSYNETSGFWEIWLEFLDNGTYYWDIYAWDKVGYGIHFGEDRELCIDTEKPDIDWWLPTPEEGEIITKDSVNISWLGFDWYSGIDHYEVRLDEEEWIDTGTTKEYTFSDLTDSSHTITVKAFDLAGNTNSSSITFIVDTEAPSVSITSPENETALETREVTVEWSGSDNGSGIDHYEVKVDGEAWEDVGTDTSYTITLDDGDYTIKVKAVDKLDHEGTTQVSFTVNTSPVGGPGMMEEIGIGIGVLVIALVIAWYFLKQKKK